MINKSGRSLGQVVREDRLTEHSRDRLNQMVELKITDPRDGGSVQRFPVEDDEQVIGEETLSWESEGFEVEVDRITELNGEAK